jgi:hypothetical protein
MKNSILCIIFVVSCLSKTEGQARSSPDTNKYRINLPGYWKPGNRVWKILTDKLPLVCEQLKDKELCGDDCRPGYTIELELSDPVIFNYYPNYIPSVYASSRFANPSEVWEIQTSYGFESSLLLKNENGVLIKRLILVDSNEVWKVSKKITLTHYAPQPPAVIYLRRTTSSRTSVLADNTNPYNQQIVPTGGQEGETPYSYIYTNQKKLVPSYRDMLLVVDLKLSSW